MIKKILSLLIFSLIFVKTQAQTPTITSFSPDSGSIGTLVKIIGANLQQPTAFSVGGVHAIMVSDTTVLPANYGDTLVGLVMPNAITGTISVTTAYGIATSIGNFTIVSTSFPSLPQGKKLVGAGATANPANQGASVSISADGNTAIWGGYSDNNSAGAVWIYTRSAGLWTQQGSKLVGTGAVNGSNGAEQGYAVGISADGNTAIVGGLYDNNNTGAVWVFIRSDGVWSQQGNKLLGTGSVGQSYQGRSVSISADGNTAIVGGYGDNSNAGAVWIYARSGGIWTQQGNKLVGAGAKNGTSGAQQGYSVSISADGNTAIVGGNSDSSNTGAVWIYTRSAGVWTQQGNKLVGTGAAGAAYQGCSVAISSDGNTAFVGGSGDNSYTGAAWIYTRSGGVWTQQGTKLPGTGMSGSASLGLSVSASADGNTAVVGGWGDNSDKGATWVYSRSAGIWSQQGNKLVGALSVGITLQGISVSISADGNTVIVGGDADNSGTGATWVFVAPPRPKYQAPPTISSFSPDSGSVGTLVTIIGRNLEIPAGFTVGAGNAIVVSDTSFLTSNYGDTLVGMVMPGATSGLLTVTTNGGTAASSNGFKVIRTPYPSTQQGSKMVGTGYVDGVGVYQGYSVAISADGNTAIEGGYEDNGYTGAVWIFTRSNGLWTQQGNKLVGTGAKTGIGSPGPDQGSSVAISADGNTAIVGGDDDYPAGAVWFFTRKDTTWAQQGNVLIGTGSLGGIGGGTAEGASVSISADGNTAIVGGPGDGSGTGAAWLFTRSAGVWKQLGSKWNGLYSNGGSRYGESVAISADGNTAVVGGVSNTWIYFRSAGVWTQQGNYLAAGAPVSVSADGNTVIAGGGIYTRSAGVWTQQASKLVGTGELGSSIQASSVSLSADGNTAVLGGYEDSSGVGATWVFTRTGTTWTQRGNKLVGTGASAYPSNQGWSVAVSSDGSTLIDGGQSDGYSVGAVWIFVVNDTNNITTGINNPLSSKLNSEIFPNPNNGAFTFKSPNAGLYSIINTLGQTVQTFKLNTTNNYIVNIEGLSNGIYFVVGLNDDQMTNQKIVVTH